MADETPTLLARETARALNRKTYFTSRPCKYGHISERYTSTQICIACSRARYKSRQSLVVKIAEQEGKTIYFTGKPCPHGHVAARFVASRTCVVCNANKKREWARKNKDKVSAYEKTYQVEHREQIRDGARKRNRANPLRKAEYGRKDYLKHRKERRALMRRWRENNAEKIKISRRVKVSANPERYAAYRRNRKARVRNAAGSHTGADIEKIYQLQRGKCACCRIGLRKKYHVDHIHPLKRGGSNSKENLQLLCPSCNGSKSAKDPIEFMQERGMLL